MTDTDTQNDAASGSQDKGTFVPLIFGGAVACALGFFGGQLEGVERWLGWSESDNGQLAATVEAQSAKLGEQSDALAALDAKVQELSARPDETVDLGPVEQALGTQSESLDQLGAKVEEFAARLTDLEQRPMTDAVSQEAIAAYEAELDGLRASIADERAAVEASVAEQKAEVAALLDQAKASESEAAAEAKRALGRAALAKIVTAVDAGTPFTDAIADLENSGAAEVPADLANIAADGAPTLAQLQDGFPSAARAALATARAGAEDKNTLGGFLKRSLGARSVAPKEGNDPDAVLSRAEAAVRQGRIGDALSEVEALPEDAQSAMSGWLDIARTRYSAQQAADALMQSLTTN